VGEVIAHLAMTLDGVIAYRTTAATNCSASMEAAMSR
jgi:hypothetical protein